MPEATYHAESDGLSAAYAQAVSRSHNLGLDAHDADGDQLALGELLSALRTHCQRYQIDIDYDWAGHDPNAWPYTPPLDVYRALQEREPNLFWTIPSGHLQNLLDAAFDRIDDQDQGLPSRFQHNAYRWCLRTFDEAYANDLSQRNARFIEEAIELVQALGMSKTSLQRVLDYVYGRPAGEPNQELGGVMVTLGVLAQANALNIADSAKTELKRCWERMSQIRVKSRNKPLA